jgi:hypothetical protein
MTVKLAKKSDGKTDDQRVRDYVLRDDIWELARKLVELENTHAKTIRLRLVKGK